MNYCTQTKALKTRKKYFSIRTYHKEVKNNKKCLMHNLITFMRNLTFVGMKKAQLS